LALGKLLSKLNALLLYLIGSTHCEAFLCVQLAWREQNAFLPFARAYSLNKMSGDIIR
jgi:hypothetical protein